MTDHTEQFIQRIKHIRLSPQEQREMRQDLQRSVQAYPHPAGWPATFMRHAFAYTLAAVVLLGGGTTILAQQSLPGDTLYPIKQQVNEKIAVAISGDEDARLDTELDQISGTLDDEEKVAANLAEDDTELETELNALERELDDATEDLPSEE